MTFDPQPLSPLSANPYSGASAPAAMHDVARQRPGGLTVIGVLSIVGGIVGLLSALFGMLGLFFGAEMASAFATGPQQQIQQEMNSKIQEITSMFMIPNVALMVSSMAVCACLLIGGIGIFRRRPQGRTLLIKAFFVATFLEVLRIAFYIATQLQMIPIMEEYMPKMMAQPGGAAPPGQAFATMMRVMMLVTLGLWVVWGIAKIALFAWGRSYLKRPLVVDHYDAHQDSLI